MLHSHQECENPWKPLWKIREEYSSPARVLNFDMCVGLPKGSRVILQQDLELGNASCKIQVMMIPKDSSWRNAHDRQWWHRFDCGSSMKKRLRSELQTLPRKTQGQESQFHPINIYLIKDGNQIGALSKVVRGIFWFTCIPLQISCQSCA